MSQPPPAWVLPDAQMCLSSLPGLARVRHWSCPERLPSLSTEELQLPPRAKDAESVARTPGLALWEEKVLNLRGLRSNKHRHLLLERRGSLEEKPSPEPPTSSDNGDGKVTTISLQERLLQAFLSTDQEAGDDSSPSEDLPGPCDRSVNLEDEDTWLRFEPQTCSALKDDNDDEAFSLQQDPQAMDLLDVKDPPLWEPGAEESQSSHISLSPPPASPPSGLVLLRPDAKPPSLHQKRCSLPQSVPHLVGPTSSYSSIAALASWLLLLPSFLPYLPGLRLSRRGVGRCRTASMIRPWQPPWVLLATTCLLLYTGPTIADTVDDFIEHEQEPEGPLCLDGIYRGNIDINNRDEDSKMSILQKYANCSVVEGSISITSALYTDQDTNYSMPKLIEVTDFVLLYRADEITSFSDIFPRLAVIRGHKLVQFYALAIFQNAGMKDVGLRSLTHIMNGGVRIEKNPSLCYVQMSMVDWTKIVQRKDDHKNIFIEDNQNPNVCPAKCPSKCQGSNNDGKCWSAEHCQRMLQVCPSGNGRHDGKPMCYADNDGDLGVACSKECIGGCTLADNNDSCFACNHTRHSDPGHPGNFTCRQICPSGFVAYKQWTCTTELECSNTQLPGIVGSFSREGDINYKVEDKQCVEKCNPHNKAVQDHDGIWRCQPCQDRCPVICIGTVVNSPKSAKKLKGCTDVTGDIVISVITSEITSILEENLQHIETIQGKLKIERSHSLVSLHFFKSLREIRGLASGSTDTKVLTIFENDNLQKLFPDGSKINMGTNPHVFIHYNQKLCQKEITQFLDRSNVRDVRDHMVSPYSNGNKIVCSEEKLRIEVNSGGPMLLQINYQNYQHKLETVSTEVDINALLGYHVYYRELTEQQFQEENMSKFEGMDVCGGSTWQIRFEEHSSSNSRIKDNNTCTDPELCCSNEGERCLIDNNSVVAIFEYPDITTYLVSLKPYTPYAVYVTTVMEKSLAGNATGAQSDIVYTRTLETKPSPVLGLVTTSEDNETTTSLEVKWRPPEEPNGVVDQYYVVLSHLELERDVTERDYCEDKEKRVLPLKAESKPADKPIGNDTCPVCPTFDETCKLEEYNDTPGRQKPPESSTVQSEQAFYNEIINHLFQIQTTASIDDGREEMPGINSRRRREVSSKSILNSVLGNSTEEEEEEMETVLVLQTRQQHHPDEEHPARTILKGTRMMEVAGKQYVNYTFQAVPGNTTQLTIQNLIHFGQYEVRVFACQKLITVDERTEYRVCSDETIFNTRTKHRKGADNIQAFNPPTSVESLHTDTNNSVLTISWHPPQNPNGMILHYELQHAVNVDGHWDTRCLSMAKIVNENGVMKYEMKEAYGEYYIRLRAISLYEEAGEWTTNQLVNVSKDNSVMIITVIVLCFLFLVAAMFGSWGYVHYRKEKELHNRNWEYSTRNPDYVDTAEVYEVDDWEVDRDDVIINQELGKGSFGMVYKGVYKDPKKGGVVTHCAVKTVNEQAGLKQRIEFLREASAMKDCNTTHVIKLIGVVSQSQPVLVLMELMENGDLKEYLRKHRPDDQNNQDGHLQVPTLAKVLEMAADIADGMAYLGNKKIIHRDLAARNCMLSADVVVKVGDFGMARDVYETEYYRKEGKGFLPVRWMAPESIRDGKFNSQSDVWSFGVVLWEMATLAEVPYQGLANDQVMSYVKEGKKMQRPENCPDILYDLMCECWEDYPNNRPTFLDICKRMLPNASEHFRMNSFYLSNEGQDAVLNQEQMQQMRKEQEEAASTNPQTPLTGQSNGSNGLSPENGHLPASDDSLAMVVIRPGTSRSPTHVQFSNEQQQQGSSRTSKLSMNGILGEIQRLRNKSGSTSGEA